MTRSSAALVTAALLAGAAPGAGRAATPEQAERARSCGVEESVVAASIERDPLIGALHERARFATRGEGPVQIIEFFDYSCPTCRAWHPILKTLSEDSSQIRVHVIDYPIFAHTVVSRITGNKTLNASLIGLAALDQGEKAALAFHDALMAGAGRVDQKRIREAAAQAGLDLAAARAAEDGVALWPERHIAYAKALGINGTPGLVVDGVILDDHAPFSCLVEKALASAASGGKNRPSPAP